MNNTELGQLLDSVIAGTTPASSAIGQLVADGHDEAHATELVFFALGGSDLDEIGDDGVARYPSGRTVAEVEADMAR